MTPLELRTLSTQGAFDKSTSGYCDGYVQANLVALPEKCAQDFETFCRSNPKPCPLLEVVGPGKHTTSKLADEADLRNVIPRYKVWIDGEARHDVQEITSFYQDDLVFFLLGCSFSFESALIRAGIALRHVEEGKNVSMYNTSVDLESVEQFHGKMVVSMRPIHYEKVVDACLITAHYPEVHGAPIHIGYPQMIGISDLQAVDYGESVTIHENEIPVFWACGVTPQNVLLHAKLPFAITHSPGYMFVSDRKNVDFYQKLY